MAGRTGYNVTKTKELMGNIEECYNNLTSLVQTGWENVQTTLQSNWVGEDEQDYEVKLAARISELFVSTHGFAQNAVTSLYDLAKGWYDFQQANKLDQGPTGGESSFGLEAIQLTKNEKIVEAKLITITDDMDRGLVNDASAENIRAALENYKTSIRSQINEMMDAVTVDSAFFGEQATSIKAFVSKVGSAMGEVITALKDMYDRLDELANANYSKSSEEATNTFGESGNVKTIESDLSTLESARWN